MCVSFLCFAYRATTSHTLFAVLVRGIPLAIWSLYFSSGHPNEAEHGEDWKDEEWEDWRKFKKWKQSGREKSHQEDSGDDRSSGEDLPWDELEVEDVQVLPDATWSSCSGDCRFRGAGHRCHRDGRISGGDREAVPAARTTSRQRDQGDSTWPEVVPVWEQPGSAVSTSWCRSRWDSSGCNWGFSRWTWARYPSSSE